MQMQEAGPSPTSAGRVPRGEPGNGATHAGARQADAPGRSVTSPDIARQAGTGRAPGCLCQEGRPQVRKGLPVLTRGGVLTVPRQASWVCRISASLTDTGPGTADDKETGKREKPGPTRGVAAVPGSEVTSTVHFQRISGTDRRGSRMTNPREAIRDLTDTAP